MILKMSNLLLILLFGKCFLVNSGSLWIMVEIKVSEKCNGCETCVNVCPVSVYEMKDGKSVPVRASDCIVCRTCESSCPQGAIQVIE